MKQVATLNLPKGDTLSLPKGWEIKKLGEVTKISYGYTEKASFSEVGPRFLRITDIQDSAVDWNSVPFCQISDADFEKYKLKDGDIVFARTGATTGKCFLVYSPPKAVFASYLIKVQVNYNELNPEFLFEYFQTQTYWDAIKLGVSGSAQGGFNATKLSDLEIPFPPLPEQLQIVSILDEAFTAIARAKANAEQNLKNTKALFESYLQNVFTENGEGWEEKPLKEIGITQTGTTPKTADKGNFGDFIPFIKPADIDISGNGEIRYDNDGLSEQGLGNGRKMLEGSTLMVCIGATIGKVGFADREVSCNQQINSLTVKKDFHPKFFYYALSTTSFFESVLLNAAQATLPIINKGKWEKLSVHYPKSLKVQQSIVQKLDALSAETKKLEAIYQKKITDLEELKKSILQKAFNGEL